ncbi:MAG: nucleoside hydrolase [Pseudomonadota bacterium]
MHLRSCMLSHLLVIFFSATLVFASGASAQSRKVIIDDDAFGLMHYMLLNAPDVEVLGITTVSGNTWANRVTAQSLRGLEISGDTNIPVIEGATFPLLNSERLTERFEALYGKLVWKGAWMREWVEPTQQTQPPYFGPFDDVDLPGGNPSTEAADEIAANFLVRMVRRYPGEISIFATGPMTNLALAQRLDPRFAEAAKELIYMGGSLRPMQALDNRSAAEFAREFVNSPRREFNVFWDPESASIVARSPWKRIVMVPVDPSTATQITPELKERMVSVASPLLAESIQGMEPGFPLWDEIAAGIWLQPYLIRESKELYVDVDTHFGPGYGNTLSWDEHYQPGLGEQKAEVIIAIDPGGLYDLMEALMGNSDGP